MTASHECVRVRVPPKRWGDGTQSRDCFPDAVGRSGTQWGWGRSEMTRQTNSQCRDRCLTMDGKEVQPLGPGPARRYPVPASARRWRTNRPRSIGNPGEDER